MKYLVTALALSCMVVGNTNAQPVNSALLKSVIAEPQVTPAVVATFTSASKVVDEEENSPALAEEEDDEEISPVKSIQGFNGTTEAQELKAREGAYISAGIKFNENKDLPVISQKEALDDEENPPVPQVTACKTDGQIAITYSEGPSDATARIARHFNNASIPANFFVNTNWLNQQQYAMVLQNVYNAGHLIGMTYRLPTEDPESMSDEEIRQDIIKNAKMIQALIHVAPKYVRLHFSAQNDGRVEKILKEMGHVLVGYNLDGKDYTSTDPKQIEKEYSRTLTEYRKTHDNKKGSFVSIQYDIPETGSMVAAPHIIELLKKEGYSPVRMDGCLNDPKPYKASVESASYVSDKFSFGTPGYAGTSSPTSIITSSTSENEEIRGLSVNDESLMESAAAKMLAPAITYVLVPALIYTLAANYI